MYRVATDKAGSLSEELVEAFLLAFDEDCFICIRVIKQATYNRPSFSRA